MINTNDRFLKPGGFLENARQIHAEYIKDDKNGTLMFKCCKNVIFVRRAASGCHCDKTITINTLRSK